MTRLLALACATGLIYIAFQAVSAGLRRPDYPSVLFGILFLLLAAGFVHFGVRRTA